MRLAVVVGILVFPLSTLASDDFPLSGLVYNTKDASSLSYSCSLKSRDELHCQFVQTRIRKKRQSENAKVDLEKALKVYRENPEPSASEVKMCTEIRDNLDVLEGRKPAPKPDRFASMNELERRDLIQLWKLLIENCSANSEKTFKRFVEFAQDIDRRTCIASSGPFEQTFKRVSEISRKRHTWVARSEPSGICGVVDLSRWEPVKTTEGKNVYTDWKYFAKKAVTNPKGKGMLGTNCAMLDEDEYEYNWIGKTRPLRCDYIEFGVF